MNDEMFLNCARLRLAESRQRQRDGQGRVPVVRCRHELPAPPPCSESTLKFESQPWRSEEEAAAHFAAARAAGSFMPGPNDAQAACQLPPVTGAYKYGTVSRVHSSWQYLGSGASFRLRRSCCWAALGLGRVANLTCLTRPRFRVGLGGLAGWRVGFKLQT
jgi:hypothetical protein